MPVLTANELKTKGVSDIERLLQDASEVVISVRGKPRYVVMEIAHYDYLRECEIATAWAQSRSDVEAGRFRREGAEAHRARVERELAVSPDMGTYNHGKRLLSEWSKTKPTGHP